MKACLPLLALGFTLRAAPGLFAADPIVIADFEGPDYGAWKTTGTAFGTGPAHGSLPRQMHVDGFLGKGLVNSFNGGDSSTGTLTSPPIKIERKFITFLIGGGGWVDETCMNLLVGGRVVRTATGPNTLPGGSERLEPAAWDVSEFINREAVIVIVDNRKGGWGHINVDQIVETNDRGQVALAAPLLPISRNASRDVVVDKKLLHFPVKTGAKKRRVTVSADGMVWRQFDIELADGGADWWAPLDVNAWKGKTLHVAVDALPEKSKALDSLRQADTLLDAESLYHEPLRPQLQFSPERGWNNDPNGLVFFNGEYHLFFQHNPYGTVWGNMHWGHATSPDLLHWREHGEALYPDDMGPMFSGSAVVDWKNTSGFGKDGKPPMVLMYTAAGHPTVQCLAYSNDGRTFTKYEGNPVLKQITPGNRDPKVFWHAPSKQWVLTLYVGLPGKAGELDKKGRPIPLHTIHFFTSPNLKGWTLRSQTPGFYECPDFFELPIDGDAAQEKWVLTAASSEYYVGAFDGRKFTPETPKLPGQRGRGFYAAQTYNDTPDKRRIQIGWGQALSPGMPFNQLLTIPCELTLRSTAEGPRLNWKPIKELESLRAKSWKAGPLELSANTANPLPDAQGELLEIRADFKPAADSEVVFKVRGVDIVYSAAKQEIVVAGLHAPAPLREGRQQLIIVTDRTYFTLWASDGYSYIPFPVIAKPNERAVEVSVKGGAATLDSLEIHQLKSIWDTPL